MKSCEISYKFILMTYLRNRFFKYKEIYIFIYVYCIHRRLIDDVTYISIYFLSVCLIGGSQACVTNVFQFGRMACRWNLRTLKTTTTRFVVCSPLINTWVLHCLLENEEVILVWECRVNYLCSCSCMLRMESMEDTVYVYSVTHTGQLHNCTGSHIIFTSDCLFARCSCIFERSEKFSYCYMWFNMTFCFRIFRTSLLSLSFLPLANSATHCSTSLRLCESLRRQNTRFFTPPPQLRSFLCLTVRPNKSQNILSICYLPSIYEWNSQSEVLFIQ
jgi:hypothetical protein